MLYVFALQRDQSDNRFTLIRSRLGIECGAHLFEHGTKLRKFGEQMEHKRGCNNHAQKNCRQHPTQSGGKSVKHQL